MVRAPWEYGLYGGANLSREGKIRLISTWLTTVSDPQVSLPRGMRCWRNRPYLSSFPFPVLRQLKLVYSLFVDYEVSIKKQGLKLQFFFWKSNHEQPIFKRCLFLIKCVAVPPGQRWAPHWKARVARTRSNIHGRQTKSLQLITRA